MSLVILEGPDGGGKTTLANELLKATIGAATLKRHGPYPGESRIAKHYLASVMDAVIHPAKLVIMDRAWHSEPIYGAAWRNGENRLSAMDVVALESAAKIAGGVLVICLPPYDVCLTAWKTRMGKEYLKKEEALKYVWHAYHRGLDRWRQALPIVAYDYTRDDLAATLEEIKEKTV